MKRLIILLGFLLIGLMSYGQIDSIPTLTNVGTNANLKAAFRTSNDAISEVNDINTELADTVSLEDSDLEDYAVLKHADTLLVTDATYTLVLADDGRYIRANRATQVKITVPPYSSVAFPIGTTINVKMDNAGIVSFYEGTGVTLESILDSMTINTEHGWAKLIKRATNKWDLSGDIQD